MTVTLAERTQAARNNTTTFSNQVIAALVMHAAYQRNGTPGSSAGVTDATKAFAMSVLNQPDAYVWRFAIRIAVDPTLDAVESMDAVPDGTVTSRVEALFPDYAPELAAE